MVEDGRKHFRNAWNLVRDIAADGIKQDTRWKHCTRPPDNKQKWMTRWDFRWDRWMWKEKKEDMEYYSMSKEYDLP